MPLPLSTPPAYPSPMTRVLFGSAVVSALLTIGFPALSQGDSSATATYPDPAGAPAPAAPAPAAPAPAAAPPPPQQQDLTQGNPRPAQAAKSPQSEDGYSVGQSGIVEPPAPPPRDEQGGKGFEVPDMSVRVDPLNWIIYGRLGLELEVAVWKFISVEMVPVFVTSEQPPFMNLGSFSGTLSQKSNGVGAMSGASIGAGFWLGSKPFVGTVLRLYYTNYGYEYLSKNDVGTIIDQTAHTERRLTGFIGSHQKWGPFTIASGIGLGVEMNRERRCFNAATLQPTTTCTKDVFEIKLADGTPQSLNGFLHPVYVDFRLSLGFVF